MNFEQNQDFLNTLSAAIRGETLAQRRLFEEYYPYVMSIALRYMHSRSEAEEVANDTFLKVFKALDRYDKAVPFKAWIRKITVNTSIDKLRSFKNRLKFLFLSDVDVSDEESKESNIIEKEAILPIIQKLPPQYRMVFNLYVFEEYKHKEIAVMLGIAEGTSKSNYSRAKTILKKLMAKESTIPTAKLVALMSTIFG